jgi:soluble lytic murein transglycosylase-like protein
MHIRLHLLGSAAHPIEGFYSLWRLIWLLVLGAASAGHAHCWDAAASRYGVDPLLLKAIAWQESRGKPSAVGPLLKDGNRAIGLMQINTIHLPTLEKFGISKNDLFDACVSIDVGAWVLADCIEKKGATWAAVGCYYGGPNSRAYDELARYVVSVQKHYSGYAAALTSNSKQRVKEPQLSGEHRAPEITFITSR